MREAEMSLGPVPAGVRRLKGGAMKGSAVGSDAMMTAKQRQMINTAVEMGNPTPTDRSLAFMAPQLVQATLPHSEPKDSPSEWWRRNGNLVLAIRPGFKTDRATGQRVSIGYPYGTVPRLLLFWMTTEALRTGSRILRPGDTVNEFMRELGMNPATGGGKRGDARRLRDQAERLFHATITFEITAGDAVAGSTEHLQMPVVDYSKTWWNFREPAQGALFESVIELGERFYKAITNAPVPVNMRTLRAIKGSALALDLYAWATYRAFTATQAGKTAFVTWEQLMGQFGADYAHVQHFRAKAKAALVTIQEVYPGLKIGDRLGGIEILPGASAVPPRPSRRWR
jgi:hypothetical protein